MGLFKDLRDMKKTAKEMQGDNPRPGFREMAAQGKEAMANAQEQMAASELAQDPNAKAGTATINAIQDTGMTVNENPSVQFELTVTDATGFSYEATHTQVVSRLQVGQLQPGAQVNVRIDPEDREKLIIV